MHAVSRLAAFTTDPRGGNPAGVVLGDVHPDPFEMQRVAAEVGYSETAFLEPRGSGQDDEPGRHTEWNVRYFAPMAEVPFCGHATIAAGVLLGDRYGPGVYVMHLGWGGVVPVDVRRNGTGGFSATLTSVAPRVETAEKELVTAALDTMGWDAHVLDDAFPPAIGYAGARHLMLGIAERATLSALHYDTAALRDIMLQADLTTVHLFWRHEPTRYSARNPFPVGGVVEDPATGAAAAAFGAYLRHFRLVVPPVRVEVLQGEDMGRPSRLVVDIDEAARPEIKVTGDAVPMA